MSTIETGASLVEEVEAADEELNQATLESDICTPKSEDTLVSPTSNVQDEYLPGAASLLEQLDKRILIVLRDGRHLVGKLRSFDQFMNLILEDTCERVLLTGKYCDFPLGLYIVRGDNIVLLGEIDEEKESGTLERIEQEQYMAIVEAGEEDEVDSAAKVVWDFE